MCGGPAHERGVESSGLVEPKGELAEHAEVCIRQRQLYVICRRDEDSEVGIDKQRM